MLPLYSMAVIPTSLLSGMKADALAVTGIVTKVAIHAIMLRLFIVFFPSQDGLLTFHIPSISLLILGSHSISTISLGASVIGGSVFFSKVGSAVWLANVCENLCAL